MCQEERDLTHSDNKNSYTNEKFLMQSDKTDMPLKPPLHNDCRLSKGGQFEWLQPIGVVNRFTDQTFLLPAASAKLKGNTCKKNFNDPYYWRTIVSTMIMHTVSGMKCGHYFIVMSQSRC